MTMSSSRKFQDERRRFSDSVMGAIRDPEDERNRVLYETAGKGRNGQDREATINWTAMGSQSTDRIKEELEGRR
jgi:hypothetical protein